MAQFTTLTSRLLPLPVRNIDTDQIIPARFLKTTNKAGLGDNLFADWRYRPDGSPNPDFALNQPKFQGAQVLLAGDNFGCGSSREHAPWALTDYGFRAVISTSFADIFRSNALKNGLLPVTVVTASLADLFDRTAQDPTLLVTIDLAAQSLTWGKGSSTRFEIDPFSKTCLLNGVDELGYLLGFAGQIAAYEARTGIAIIR